MVAVAPNDLRARRALALVLASRHAGVELAAELGEVVRLDPEDLDARLDLGAALASIGQIDPAIAVYEEVLRRRPRQAPVLKLAGDLYRAKGDGAKAAAFYERLHRVAPDDPRPVFLLGSAYYQSGRLDAAERMFTEGARYPGMLGDAYSNLGAIAVRRGQVKEALWFLSRAAQRRPGKAQVRYNYGLALRAAERFEDALGELQAAVKIDPNDADVPLRQRRRRAAPRPRRRSAGRLSGGAAHRSGARERPSQPGAARISARPVRGFVLLREVRRGASGQYETPRRQ